MIDTSSWRYHAMVLRVMAWILGITSLTIAVFAFIYVRAPFGVVLALSPIPVFYGFYELVRRSRSFSRMTQAFEAAGVNRPPLHIAAARGQADVVELLLDSGRAKDIDAVDAEGRTAMYRAIEAGRTDVAERLLRRGASVDSPTLGLAEIQADRRLLDKLRDTADGARA